MIWGLPLAVALTWLTNRVSTGVLDRAKCQQTCSESPARLTQEDNKNIACLSFLTGLSPSLTCPITKTFSYTILIKKTLLVSDIISTLSTQGKAEC
ncbi:solute carrier family 40 member 3, chloroplastic-like [Spinacia oleracea]|uniref:Solute carrier family 40 member 3, chloroplastic-like n=1 Tax=Spinacia oleracea TaxID=3562 RepID=A0ABM3R241_SPIOL|nr:solute carrier family 40 member 3, chloroplastic-like [Spinacia oleracea]